MTTRPPRLVSLSVVSHGQGALVRNLLADLRQGVDVPFEVIVTLNIPEDETFLSEAHDLPLRVLRNMSPKGFGANHNAAFHLARGSHFAVVNPDVRARPLALSPLLTALAAEQVGACAPLVLSPQGRVEDSARRFPTIPRLFRRMLLPRRGPDYQWAAKPINVDWVAGMFIVFRREAFAALSGFDERYFMYLEDADICRRLRAQGWQVKLDPGTTVIHDARRASRRNIKHLLWHLRSAVRFVANL